MSEKYIASVSTKGTIIRIFNLNGELINEYRRGIEKTYINWLCFNKQSNILLCHSKKGTIHLFKIKTPDDSIFSYFFSSSGDKFSIPSAGSKVPSDPIVINTLPASSTNTNCLPEG